MWDAPRPSSFEAKRAVDDLFRIPEIDEEALFLAASAIVRYGWDLALLIPGGRREEEEFTAARSVAGSVAIPVHRQRNAPEYVRRAGFYEIVQPSFGVLQVAHSSGRVARDRRDPRKYIVWPTAEISYNTKSNARDPTRVRVARGDVFFCILGICLIERSYREIKKGHRRAWKRPGFEFAPPLDQDG